MGHAARLSEVAKHPPRGFVRAQSSIQNWSGNAEGYSNPWVVTFPRRRGTLDGRNCAIVIAESLARVIVAIRIASVCWQSYLPPETQKLVLTDPAFVVLRF